MATENAQANSSGVPQEKDFSHTSNHYGEGSNSYEINDMSIGSEDALKRIKTAGSISISPELFEKIYLSPQNAVKGDLRKTFGNPTPVAIVGFLITLSPLSCDLMGWRGAGNNGAAGIGSYFFFGGLLMIVGGFLEFVLGNTFPFVVFISFGAFWLTFASTLQPFYYAYGLYSPPGGTPTDGLKTVGFNASFGFFFVFMGVLCLIYLVCSLRTNVVFVIIFFTLVVAFSLLTSVYWHTANGIGNNDATRLALANRLQIAAGATLFVTSLAGWWIFFAIMLAALDFPLQIPVGDLSTLIKGASEREKSKEQMA
ncbi:putative plasma membrane protein [Botrytis fragariae]|uniref:Putative plasma membrane protein n=1 Tax=Botrytis fragariae TaxID=1964551 RepID=A0A8H6EDY4_9HELO|nr:putative plasma membrane protein [Botrytis fragariae]KAF5868757.1 putative plasma membrane protein [Botrytis fragariae]